MADSYNFTDTEPAVSNDATPSPTVDSALLPEHVSIPTVYILLSAAAVVVCACGAVCLLLCYIRKTRSDLTKTVNQMTAVLRDVHQMGSQMRIESVSPGASPLTTPSPNNGHPFGDRYAAAAHNEQQSRENTCMEPSHTQTMHTITMPPGPTSPSQGTHPYPWAVPPPLPALPNNNNNQQQPYNNSKSQKNINAQNGQNRTKRIHFAQTPNAQNVTRANTDRNRQRPQRVRSITDHIPPAPGGPPPMLKSRSVPDEDEPRQPKSAGHNYMMKPNLHTQMQQHSAQPYYGSGPIHVQPQPQPRGRPQPQNQSQQQSQQPWQGHPNQLMVAQATSPIYNSAPMSPHTKSMKNIHANPWTQSAQPRGRARSRSISNGYKDLEQAHFRHAQSMGAALAQKREVPASVRNLLATVTTPTDSDNMAAREIEESETDSESMAEEDADDDEDDESYDDSTYTDSEEDYDEHEAEEHFADVQGPQRLTINVENGPLPSDGPAMQMAESNARALDRLRNSNRPRQDTVETIDTVNTATTANTNDTLLVHAGNNSHAFGLPENVQLKEMASTEL